MEVFSVFATLSLVDMLSSPLGKIKQAMAGVDLTTSGLGDRMGNLAVAMAPVALAAGVLLGVFGLAASKAMAFESAMADVAKVVNFDTQAEFDAMSETVKEMAGRIPMAADGIAAIIAAAGQSGVAKQDLTEFAEQAAKMGVAFDLTGAQAGKMMSDWRAGMNLTLPQVYALADATNYLSNNMNAAAPALGEVIQRVGAAAMSCGLAETQVAALGAAFLSAGASPEIAATALKKFTTTLVKGSALSKDAQAAFQGLGFSATQMAKDMQTDAQGTIFKVLQAIAKKPKELQMSLLTEMFGEESIGAIAPLLQNMDNLSQAFDLVSDKTKFAGSMQAEYDTRSKTTQNALQLLTNKLTNLAISVGNIFLPAIRIGAIALGWLADGLRGAIDTPIGRWLVAMSGGLAASIVAVTALSAGMWAATKAAPLVVKAMAPIRAALLGLGWPIWALIAAGVALYAAYQSNFGGIADILNSWWRTISLVVKGVIAIFANLTGSTAEIRGELATEIKASGLESLVTNVAKAAYRIKEFFSGVAASLNFDGAIAALIPAILTVRELFTTLGNTIGSIFGVEVKSAASEARGLGSILGGFLSWCLEGVATVIANVVRGIDSLVSMFRLVYAVLTGDWATAASMAENIWNNFCQSLLAFADLFRIGDWVRQAWADATDWFSSIDLFESGARLLDTFKEGILSRVTDLKETFSDALSSLRNLLPFSDAKEGPLSTLTLSGSRLMSTLGEGMSSGAPGLYKTLSGALGGVRDGIGGIWNGLWGKNEVPDPTVGGTMAANVSPVPTLENAPSPTIPPAPGASGAIAEEQARRARQDGDRAAAPQSWTLHIGNITLPNVKDAQDFFNELQAAATDLGEGMA